MPTPRQRALLCSVVLSAVVLSGVVLSGVVLIGVVLIGVVLISLVLGNHERQHLLGSQRLAVKESLDFGATGSTQKCCLRRRLDAFGDDVEVQTPSLARR